jgi:hypothetical protein
MRNRQRERFARAADALTGSPADPASPGTASAAGAAPAEAAEPHDPRLAGEFAVLLRLNRTAEATAPDAAARDRMRAAVLAGLPEILADQAATATSTTLSTPSATAPAAAPAPAPARTRRSTGTRGRLAIAVGAAFCLVLALCGMTMLLSNNALPGDPLYGLRRTVESAAMSLTFGDESKGFKHLSFAADRIDDIDSLAARYPDLSDSPAGDYLTAFADFDSDASAGSVDLTGYASGNGPDVLNQLSGWAKQQAGRITAVGPKLPPQARAAGTSSRTLLTRIEARASALLARTSCYTVTSGGSDDIGVLPATGPCDHAPSDVTSAPNPAPSSADVPVSQVPPAPVPSSANPSAGTNLVPGQPTAAVPPTSIPALPPPVTPPTDPGVPTTPVLPGPPTITLPLPLPIGAIPPLLPGLPWLRVGT